MREGEGDGSTARAVGGRLAGGHVEHAGLVAVKVVETVAGVVLISPENNEKEVKISSTKS